jgi:hypothetical protein
VAVDLGEDLDVVAGVGDPRRADEHRVGGLLTPQNPQCWVSVTP